MSAMDRRTFCQTGAAGLAAMAATSLVSTAAADEVTQDTASGDGMQTLTTGLEYEYYPPVEGTVAFESRAIGDDKIAETVETDLVVCGAGLAGVTLALAATKFGLATVLLEKTALLNVRGSGIGSLGCSLVKDAGIEFDTQAYLNDAMKAALYRCDINIWKRWIEYNGEAVDWLINETAGEITPWLNLTGSGNATDTFGGVTTWNDTIEAEEGMYAWAEVELNHAIDNGADVRWETPAVQLVQGEDGSVTGVIAKNADGAYIRFNASKGVALCTGGYENNWEMLKRNMRPEDLNVVAWRLPNTQNTGDGQMMGEAVGGVMEPYPHIMMRDPGGSAKAHQSMTFLSCRWPRVNINGQRFVNECISHNDLANAFMRQPGGKDFLILAGPTLQEAMDATTFKAHTPGAAKRETQDIIEQAQDVIITAETLDELAELTGIDAENLKATCERMTELYEMGEDVDFGTDPGMLMSYATGPYYAAEEGASDLVTVSGLRVTPQSEVIDKTGNAIPGLYAVGNCSGGMFNDSYPHELSGISHSRCVVFAYLLAKDLAQA